MRVVTFRVTFLQISIVHFSSAHWTVKHQALTSMHIPEIPRSVDGERIHLPVSVVSLTGGVMVTFSAGMTERSSFA